jgi:hypothetical protein
MAKFRGVIGFGESTETAPGVWQDVITESTYSGDVLQSALQTEPSTDTVNLDRSIDNAISIVGNDYAFAHFFAIRYIKWAGKLWTITHIDLKYPRLILRMGGVYDGPTAPAPNPPGNDY